MEKNNGFLKFDMAILGPGRFIASYRVEDKEKVTNFLFSTGYKLMGETVSEGKVEQEWKGEAIEALYKKMEEDKKAGIIP